MSIVCLFPLPLLCGILLWTQHCPATFQFWKRSFLFCFAFFFFWQKWKQKKRLSPFCCFAWNFYLLPRATLHSMPEYCNLFLSTAFKKKDGRKKRNSWLVQMLTWMIKVSPASGSICCKWFCWCGFAASFPVISLALFWNINVDVAVVQYSPWLTGQNRYKRMFICKPHSRFCCVNSTKTCRTE